MSTQNFKSHARYVPLYHFVTLFIVLAALVISFVLLAKDCSLMSCWCVLTSLGVTLSAFFLRTFATANQDRIIRAEESFRYFRITGKTLDPKLTCPQIVALRFANDNQEYLDLMEKALRQNLTARQIKESIKDWKADDQRV